MDYPIKRTLSLEKVPLTSNGVNESICTYCKTRDCTNKIEWKEVSLFGICKKYRLYMKYSEPVIVIDCEGFSQD